MSLTDYTFLHLTVPPVCSLRMWQVLLWANEPLLLPLLFLPGPNICLLLYPHTQFPLVPSSWSINKPYSLLPKKSLSTLQPPLSHQCLWPPHPHPLGTLPFFFYHPSDFLSDANTELPLPKVMVLPNLPHPHHFSDSQKYRPSSVPGTAALLGDTTLRFCPTSLLALFFFLHFLL